MRSIVRFLVSCHVLLLVNTAFDPNIPEFVAKRRKMLSFIYQDQCNELNFMNREFEDTKRWHYVLRPLSVVRSKRAKAEWMATKGVGDAACAEALYLLTGLPGDEIYECAGAVLPSCRELVRGGWTCTILFHDADRIDPPLLLSLRFCTMKSWERYALYRNQLEAEAGSNASLESAFTDPNRYFPRPRYDSDSASSRSSSSRSSSKNSRALGKVLDDGIVDNRERGSHSVSKGKVPEGAHHKQLSERSKSKSSSRSSQRSKSPGGGSLRGGNPGGASPMGGNQPYQISNGDLLNAYVASYQNRDWENESGSSKKSKADMVSDWVYSGGTRYWDTDRDLDTGGSMVEEGEIDREGGQGSDKSSAKGSGSIKRNRVRDWVATTATTAAAAAATTTASRAAGRVNSKDRNDRSGSTGRGKVRYMDLKLNKPRPGDVAIVQ